VELAELTLAPLSDPSPRDCLCGMYILRIRIEYVLCFKLVLIYSDTSRNSWYKKKTTRIVSEYDFSARICQPVSRRPERTEASVRLMPSKCEVTTQYTANPPLLRS